MIKDDSEFLAAIGKNPDGDELQLAYANWLAKGDSTCEEFIRVQCALATMAQDDPRRMALVKQESALLPAQRKYWQSKLPQTTPPIDIKSLRFKRGFPVLTDQIIHAIKTNSMDQFHALLHSGVPVESRAVNAAVIYNSSEALNALLAQDASIEPEALTNAILFNLPEIFNTLMKYRAPIEPEALTSTVILDRSEMFTRLLEQDVPIASKSRALTEAVTHNRPQMFDRLLEQGTPVEPEAVIEAINYNRPEMFNALLERGACISENAKYRAKTSPNRYFERRMEKVLAEMRIGPQRADGSRAPTDNGLRER